MAGVDASGFIKKAFSEVVDSLKSRFRQVFGNNIDVGDTSPLGRIASSVSTEISLLWEKLEEVYYSAFIDTATGVNLDRVAALLGIRRKQATKATGTVTFSRSSPATRDIVIPAGTRVSTQNGIIFATTQEAVLQAGNTSVDVPVEATEPGSAGNVAAGTIVVLVDPVSGIDAVTNTSATSGGSDVESDEQLRLRTITYAPSANATVYSIEAAILALDGVTDVNVSEDFANGQLIITVAGGNDADIQSTIDEKRGAGVQAIWQRPTYVSISVTAELAKDATYDANTVQQNVEQAINDYISALRIGEDVVYSDLAKAILTAEGVDDIISLSATDGTNTISAFGEVIPISTYEKASPGTHTITVS